MHLVNQKPLRLYALLFGPGSSDVVLVPDRYFLNLQL